MKEKAFITEIKYIKNKKFRDNLEVMIKLLPDYFFTVPASSTGKYHPMFSLNEGGLLRHTKVAAKIAFDLLSDDVIGNIFTEDEKDLMIFSIILHDGLKHGINESKYTLFEHPILMANFIKENKEKLTLNEKEIDMISSMIAAHMGPWNTNQYSDITLPIPKGKYQKFVHMCDYLSSRKYLDVKFKDNEIEE